MTAIIISLNTFNPFIYLSTICLSLPASSQHQASQQQNRENDSCEDSQSEIISQSAGDEAYQGRTAGAAQVSGQRQHGEQ